MRNTIMWGFVVFMLRLLPRLRFTEGQIKREGFDMADGGQGLTAKFKPPAYVKDNSHASARVEGARDFYDVMLIVAD